MLYCPAFGKFTLRLIDNQPNRHHKSALRELNCAATSIVSIFICSAIILLPLSSLHTTLYPHKQPDYDRTNTHRSPFRLRRSGAAFQERTEEGTEGKGKGEIIVFSGSSSGLHRTSAERFLFRQRRRQQPKPASSLSARRKRLPMEKMYLLALMAIYLLLDLKTSSLLAPRAKTSPTSVTARTQKSHLDAGSRMPVSSPQSWPS